MLADDKKYEILV